MTMPFWKANLKIYIWLKKFVLYATKHKIICITKNFIKFTYTINSVVARYKIVEKRYNKLIQELFVNTQINGQLVHFICQNNLKTLYNIWFSISRNIILMLFDNNLLYGHCKCPNEISSIIFIYICIFVKGISSLQT